jgi:hypothetical protein
LSSPKDRVLDLLVFAPAGIALTVVEQLPELAEKGRNRIEGQAATARVVGQFVVQIGRTEITKRARHLMGSDTPSPAGAPAKPAQQSSRAPEPDASQAAAPVTERDRPSVVAQAPTGSETVSDAAAAGVDLAIPAYDTLSASQVVKRLNGLSHDELLEVGQHERSNRHRATILNRVEQLLSEPVRGTS